MLHPIIVRKLIDAIELKMGIQLTEYPVEKCVKVYEHFQSITQSDGKKSWYQRSGEGHTQENFVLQKWESEWIRNELLMCRCSFEYWFYRYFFLKDISGSIRRPDTTVAIQMFLDVIRELDLKRLPMMLLILKARQLGMCLDPSTRILTSNLEWVSIDDILPGQELVSVDEFPPGGRGAGRKMRKCVVEARRDVYETGLRLTMEDGRVLISTPQHRFMSKVRGGTSTVWRHSGDFKIGDEIRYITHPWGTSDFEDGWFGGLIDGEGSLAKESRKGANIGVAQVPGNVLDRAEAYLRGEGYSLREEIDNRKPGKSSKLGSKVVHKLVLSRMDEIFRLIGKTKPSRFRKEWWVGKDLPGKKSGIGWSKVVKIEALPTQRMVDLQTSTKTFIAEGFVSHNSTITEAIIIWIALFRKGSNCIISSAEEDKSLKMSDMVWRCLDNLPLWMKPTLTGEDRQKGPEFGYLDSLISIQHGSMKKGIGRGDTPVACHLSECAWYPDPVNTIESSLFKAMHENKRSFLALESTAKKKGDWWHKTWEYNREMTPKGMNKFTCIFLPWYVGNDKYPTHDWILNHPIPDDWKPNSITLKQANRAQLYVAETPLLRKYMGAGWKMPVEQMWFYEFEYTSAARSDDTLKSFFAEMCSDEREAFQSKRWSVYSAEVLERIESNIGQKYVDYAISGNGIDPKFHLKSYQSRSAKRIEVYWQDMEGKPLEWKLIPLRETPEPEEEWFYLRVWELPKRGYNYTIGIDFSGGVGQDSTVFEVLRVGRDEYEPDVQVAQLYSPYISSPEAPPFANCLGILYGQHMSPTPEAYMCPEVQVSTGDPTSHQLSRLGYTNFHYMRRYDQRKHPNSQPTRRGWATVGWSRQMMLEHLKMGIDNGWIVINSDKTVQELNNQESEEMDSGKTKYDHADGENDDSIFGLGIAYFCSHDDEALASRKGGKRPRSPKETAQPEVETDSTEMMLARHFQREDAVHSGYHQQDEEGGPYAW